MYGKETCQPASLTASQHSKAQAQSISYMEPVEPITTGNPRLLERLRFAQPAAS